MKYILGIVAKDLTLSIKSFTMASNMKNEDMLKLRLEGKSHAEIAKMSTKQGRPLTKQGVQWILKQFPVSKVYVLDGAESTQDSSQRGVKGILDKVILRVKKFL